MSPRTGRPQALREQRFQAIYDSVNDGIFLQELETGALLDANRRICEWFGYELEAFLKLDLGQLGLGLWPFTPEKAKEWARLAEDGPAQSFEWLCSTQSGQLLWLDVNMRRADIGGQDRLVVTATDITERKRVEMEHASRLKRAEAQNAVSLTLAGAGLDYQTALKLIAHHLATQVGDLCALELLGADGLLHAAEVSQAYIGGNPVLPAFAELTPLPLGIFGSGRVAQEGSALRVVDPSGARILTLMRPEFHPYLQQFNMHSLLIVSMRTEKMAIGTITLARGGASKPYSLEDQAMLQNLADRAALTVTNARLYAQNIGQAAELKAANLELERRVEERTAELAQANGRLQQMALEDGLTRLANRRHFDTVLAAEVRRAQRSGEPLALLLGDVDFFKRFNDCHGHLAGDACLQTVGEVMMDIFRRSEDLPARYGGEEFAVILPGCDARQARSAAEKFRLAVEAAGIVHGDSDVAERVTISVGYVSTQVLAETTPAWFIKRADEGLYRSKAEGRNRVSEAL